VLVIDLLDVGSAAAGYQYYSILQRFQGMMSNNNVSHCCCCRLKTGRMPCLLGLALWMMTKSRLLQLMYLTLPAGQPGDSRA
jgi:hypothetical protein